jgi:hypothetical protein
MSLKKSGSNKSLAFNELHARIDPTVSEGGTLAVSLNDTDVKRAAFVSDTHTGQLNMNAFQNVTCMTAATGLNNFAGYRRNTSGAITEGVLASPNDGGFRFSSSYATSHILQDLYQQGGSYGTLFLYFKVVTSSLGSSGGYTVHDWASIHTREDRHGSTAYSTWKKAYASFNSYTNTWSWNSGYSSVFGYGLSAGTANNKVFIRLTAA